MNLLSDLIVNQNLNVTGDLIIAGDENSDDQATTITSSTADTTIVTAASGVKHHLTALAITSSSSTGTLVTLKDNGTTRGSWYIGPGGGGPLYFPTRFKQATANTAWTLTCGTSVASIYVVAHYVIV